MQQKRLSNPKEPLRGERLLAKPFGTPEEEHAALLLSHLKYTFEAAKAILGLVDSAETTTVLGAFAKAQLELVGLDTARFGDRFQRLVLLAAAIHDLGKANRCFQGAVRGKNREGQPIRHEWLLYLLLRTSPLGDWLRNSLETNAAGTNLHDFDILVWAVVGHHRKILDEATHNVQGTRLMASSPDFRECLEWIAHQKILNLPAIPFKPEDLDQTPWNPPTRRRPSMLHYSKPPKTLQEVFEKPGNTQSVYLNECIPYWDSDEDWAEISPPGEERRLMAIVRSTLMSADVLASAAAGRLSENSEGSEEPKASSKHGTKSENAEAVDGEILNRIRDWVDGTLGDTRATALYQEVLRQKQREILKTSDATDEISNQRREFQQQAADVDRRGRVTLISAGCGSGKTLAAYLWAEAQCRKYGDRRLCFCYPTTGTATAGYMDYLVGNQGVWGQLIHSRSDADYQIFERLKDVQNPETDEEPNLVMSSLRFWTGKLTCCTADTVLGILVNTYSGHLAWSALAQSMFVFDEIHSYDDTLFGWLLKFLKTMRGARILLMTASLPKHRLRALELALKSCGETLDSSVRGPVIWEEIRRYQRYLRHDTPFESISDVRQARPTELPKTAVVEAIKRYRAGAKVLWICNTVERALDTMDAVRQALEKQEETDELPIVYHSHFRYRDRVKRHEAIIEAFRKPGGTICITTQVAEMSLDISADFLLMDLAPIPTMIQRLGRLNRRTTCDAPCPFLVLPLPEAARGGPDLLPYSETPNRAWFDQACAWLESLGTEPLSQSALIDHWEKQVEMEVATEKRTPSPWLAAGPGMTHDNLRDASTGCEVILREDLDELERGIAKGEWRATYVQLAIPMTRPPKSRGERLVQKLRYGCFVVENGIDVRYDPQHGCKWL